MPRPSIASPSSERAAKKWKKLPKGWTDESVKKFWDSLTSRAPKHPVKRCINEMEGKMSNPGAFCGGLADQQIPGWREEAAKERKKKAGQGVTSDEVLEYLTDAGAELTASELAVQMRVPLREVEDALHDLQEERRVRSRGFGTYTPTGRRASCACGKPTCTCCQNQALSLQPDYERGMAARVSGRWASSRMHLTFYECEHGGDLDHYLDDIYNSGGKVIRSQVERDEECSVLVEVEDKQDFLKRFKRTKSYGFSDLG